jgi:thiamine-phosphate pyrophosphorylase
MNVPAQGVYAITDCQNLNSAQLFEITEEILRAGIAMLQYRDKTPDQKVRTYRANQLRKLCTTHHVPFIINDDLELARNVRADGIHLGKDDTSPVLARELLGCDSIIGISCYNSLERALQARDYNVDYVAFGSFFPSQTKPGAVRAIPELLTQAREMIDTPLVAIGGITLENGGILINSGADMLAIISGIYGQANPEQVTRSYKQLFDTNMENNIL